VKHRTMKWAILLMTLAAIMLLGACKKKVAPPPPPPPPPPAAPTASLTASPDTIERGQSTTLTWQTTNATDVTLGPNKVEPNGSATVSPTESTTFQLTAKGPGGTKDATARVTVTAPPPPPPPQPTVTDQELFNQNVKDVFFDFDSYNLRPDAQAAIQQDVQFLKEHPSITFTIEGHCDERGSTEYNLALGDNRANAVKNALVQDGISADRIRTISYGKEKPFCTESNEQCWQENRRAHFVYGK
jgi:peptidoglycan-associated lipoprotein